MKGMNGFPIYVRVRERLAKEVNGTNYMQRKDQITLHTLHIVNKDKKNKGLRMLRV